MFSMSTKSLTAVCSWKSISVLKVGYLKSDIQLNYRSPLAEPSVWRQQFSKLSRRGKIALCLMQAQQRLVWKWCYWDVWERSEHFYGTSSTEYLRIIENTLFHHEVVVHNGEYRHSPSRRRMYVTLFLIPVTLLRPTRLNVRHTVKIMTIASKIMVEMNPIMLAMCTSMLQKRSILYILLTEGVWQLAEVEY